MDPIRRIQYDTWDEFAGSLRPELFGDDHFRRGRYLFRGLPDYNFELVSSFDRLFPESQDRQRISTELMAAFREEARGQVEETILQDDVKTLALGQHHGLPTRLLDWSDSPYVAAFFALSSALPFGADPDHFVAVWVLHVEAPIWGREYGVEIVGVPASPDFRIRNQAGRFTLARTPDRTLEQYVGSFELPEFALTQTFFPASQARHGLADLAMMGITSSRLFPDLTGAANAAKTSVLLDAVPARTGARRR